MSGNYKGLIIILDGLGDRSIPALNYVTPLEAANTPNLDRLLTAGMSGLVDPIIPGVPVGTHTGTGALFGLSPRDVNQLSRGPVEAAGIGMPSQPGDVFVRCNFATLKSNTDGLTILDRRAGRIRKGTDELAAALQNMTLYDGVTAALRPATQHRAVLRLSGTNLSADISDTDPGTITEPNNHVLICQPLAPDNVASVKTAKLLNQVIQEAFKRLNDHPVNHQRIERGELPATGIITRGAGTALLLESFITHLGLKTAVVAGERTVLGLGKLLNFTVVTDPAFTGSTDTDLEGMVRATQQAIKDHNLVYLHFKGTDICSHDCDPEGKKLFLERVDKAISPLLDDGLVIGVTADHSTDSNSGRHCGDPVPSILYAPLGRRDTTRVFGEMECAGGGLGRIGSHSFLYSILDNMGFLHQYQPTDWKFFKPRR